MHHNSLRVVCIVVVELFAIACSKVSFYGRTETGRNFIDGMAADAGGRKDAILRNLPKNPSNTQVLDVFVDNISNYKYALVVGKTDCTDAAYSKPINYLEHIRDDLGADGDKGLCVVGVRGDVAVQSSPTQYFWTKDTVAPGAFALAGISSPLRRSPDSVSWSKSIDSDSYTLKISQKQDCADPVVMLNTIKTETVAIDKLNDGQYYVCLESRDLAGNNTVASNSGLSFVLDSQAPTAFSINRPFSVTNVVKPEISWDASSGDATFDFVLGADAACTTKIESRENFVDNKYTPVNPLVDGSTYYVCVSAKDLAGNITPATNNGYSFRVDTTGVVVSFQPVPPNTTLPSGPSNDTRLQVKVVGTDVAFYRYKIVPAPAQAQVAAVCSDARNYSADIPILTPIDADVSSLPDGRLMICAYGSDAAGNWTDQSGAIPFNHFEWFKDVTKPVISFVDPQQYYCGPVKCPTVIDAADGTVVNAVAAGAAATTASAIQSVKLTVQDLNAAAPSFMTAQGTFTAASAQTSLVPVLSSNSTQFSFEFSGSGLINGRTYRVRVVATDAAGNISVPASKDITWDEVAPTVSLLKVARREDELNYFPTVTTKVNFVTMSVGGNGTGSPIEKYCFKTDSTVAPTPSDSCWTALPENEQQINWAKNGLPNRVSFTPGIYIVRAWISDQAGNISSVGALSARVDYKPILPPALSHLYVTYKVGDPLPSPLNTISVNNNRVVYIRWGVSTKNDRGLGKLKISYTTNDTDYVDLGVSLDADSKNDAACSLSTANSPTTKEYAGCYKWTIPNVVDVTKYLRFRIQAVDVDDMLAFGQTNALHLPQFNFLAGNTETGLGGTSTAAILAPVGTQNLVVHPSGRIFILDKRGLLVVDPIDGLLKVFIDEANLNVQVGKIALDNSGNLLIYNGDSIKQVRNVDILAGLSNMTTVIGGGSKTDDAVAPLELFMKAAADPSLFFVAPNNDIYFQSDFQAQTSTAGARIRRAVAANSFAVESIKFSGVTTILWSNVLPAERPSTVPIEDCRLWSAAFIFNQTSKMPEAVFPLLSPNGQTDLASHCWLNVGRRPYTSYYDYTRFKYEAGMFKLDSSQPVIPSLSNADPALLGVREGNDVRYFQSLSGSLFARVNGVGLNNDYVVKYEPAPKNAWEILAGRENGGECVDGTLATACSINLSSLFVDAQDKVYMIDNNVVRIIGDDKKMLTIAGQSKSAGDGKNPLNARFNQVGAFDFYPKASNNVASSNPKFVVSDAIGLRLREFGENGTIESIAGNGVDYADADPNVWKNARAKDLSLSWGKDLPNSSFKLSETGDVFIMKFQSNIPFKINRAASDPATHKWEALSDTLPLSGNGYGAQVLAMDHGKLLFGNSNYLGVAKSLGNGRLYEQSTTFSATNAPTMILSKPRADQPVTTEFPFMDGDCPAGTERLKCNGARTGTGFMPQGTFDTGLSDWVIAINGAVTSRIVRFKVTANPASDQVDDVLSFPKIPPATKAPQVWSFALAGSLTAPIAYVCLDGKIYKYMLPTPASPAVPVGTELDFPVNGMTCSRSSGSMLYSTERRKSEGGTLVFGYELNGLQGIAEFVNP